MFEPLWNVYKVGDDNTSEAETERFIVDDDASHMSEDCKTEKNYGPPIKINEENIISHRKGERLMLYFYSVFSKPTFEYFSQMVEIKRNNQNWRVVCINYDQLDAPVSETVAELPEYQMLEWYSIDSGSLNNSHLEKYSLCILPKLLVSKLQI